MGGKGYWQRSRGLPTSRESSGEEQATAEVSRLCDNSSVKETGFFRVTRKMFFQLGVRRSPRAYASIRLIGANIPAGISPVFFFFS